MNLKKLFSPKVLIEAIEAVIARFPASACFLAAWTVWMLLLVTKAINPSGNLEIAATWSLSLGFFLCTAVTIWTEYLDRERLQKPLIAIASLLAFADFVIILVWGTSSQAGEIGRTALMTGIVVSILFLPVSKGLNRDQLTAYTFHQFSVVASAMCMSIIFGISIFIIYATLEALFGSISIDIFQVFLVVLCGTVQAIYYLNYVPRRSDISHGHTGNLRIIAVCARNIILPICIVYMAILYVYGFKILFTWSLPKGILTWSVTGLSVVSLVVLYCMQPFYASGNKIAILARRILPVLMLPLIVLMSVGLIYRFGEYGPTASRVYVALFAVWAFATFLWLTIRSSANMNLIAMTFAGTFVAVSILPGLNVSKLVNNYIHSQIINALQGNTLPLDVDSLRAVIGNMPEKEGRLMASRIVYLDSWDDHSMVRDIVRSNYKLSEWELSDDYDEIEVVSDIIEYNVDDQKIALPEGYTAMQKTKLADVYGRPKTHDIIKLDSGEVQIPTDSIVEHGLTSPLIREVNDSTLFYLTKIEIRDDTDSTLINEAEGVLFFRR